MISQHLRGSGDDMAMGQSSTRVPFTRGSHGYGFAYGNRGPQTFVNLFPFTIATQFFGTHTQMGVRAVFVSFGGVLLGVTERENKRKKPEGPLAP